MKRAYLLAEGKTDLEFLRRILPSELLDDVELVNAGGRNGIASLARTLLVTRRRPILVVMDADSNNPDVAEERRQLMEETIRFADSLVPVKVIAAIPELESWLFATPDTLAHVLGQPASDEFFALGASNPKRALEHWAASHQQNWDLTAAINSLDADDILSIRQISAVAELIAFLEQIQVSERAA